MIIERGYSVAMDKTKTKKKEAVVTSSTLDKNPNAAAISVHSRAAYASYSQGPQ